MSPSPNRVGIDPALMTQLIAEMKRIERSWSEVDVQLYNALRTVGTSLPGPGLLRDIGYQIGQEVPSLQRRLDLIISTQKIGLDKGVVWADETLWASNSPAAGAAAATTAAEQLRQAQKNADPVKGQKVLSPETLKLLEKHWAAEEPEAFKTVAEGHGEYSLMALNARGAEIAKEMKAEFAAWRKENPNATEAEQSAVKQKMIKDAMSGNEGDFFNARVAGLSKSLYFLIDSANIASINEADRKDQLDKAFIDAVTRTAKLALTPAGDGVNAVFDFVEAYASDNLQPDRGEKARAEAADKLTQSQNLFKLLTANVMLRHGLFGDENAPGSGHPHAAENYAKGSRGDFLIDGRIKPLDLMDTDEAYAYDEWLKHSIASGIFKNTDKAVTDSFELPPPPYEAPKS